MGASPCKIIIMEGNLTYGIIERYSKTAQDLDFSMLEAAVKASCDIINFAGIISEFEKTYISEEMTKPIIDLHKDIIHALTNSNEVVTQSSTNKLAIRLFKASRQLYLLDGAMPEGLANLHNIIGD